MVYLFTSTVAYPAYSPSMETEIRNETVLSGSYDPVSRPRAQTHIKAGLSILAIDELVSFIYIVSGLTVI